MRPTTLLVLILFGFSGTAQKLITVTPEWDDEGDLIFYCENRGAGEYTVYVDVSSVVGLRSEVPLPYAKTVSKGRSRLFKMTRTGSSGSQSYKYSISYHIGCLSPKVDNKVTYLLPVKEGKKTKAMDLSYAGNIFGKIAPINWNSKLFTMNEGDTVVAMREGIVVDTRDIDSPSSSDYWYTSSSNYVRLLHDDCTVGAYQVFKEGSIMVEPGDKVYPGDHLGIAGGENYGMQWQIRAMVYRYTKNTKTRMVREPQIEFIDLKFLTSNGIEAVVNGRNYTAVHSREVITQEMSKREFKKYVKGEL